ALYFEAELAKVIVELQQVRLLALRADLTADHAARALANGARGVNQRLPPIPPDDLAENYREMCRFILYGCADMPMEAEDTCAPVSNKVSSDVLDRRQPSKG